jgi:hypothetical protein
MKPNESLLNAHLEGAPFLAGVDCGRWGLYAASDLTFPVIWVRGDKRVVQAGRVHLRFDTNGYSQQAPTACPWDVTTNGKLPPALWPKGASAATVFNPAWKDDALYAPCDRVAMQGHDAWKSLCPQWWWQPSFTIVVCLEFVHVCLNPVDHEN